MTQPRGKSYTVQLTVGSPIEVELVSGYTTLSESIYQGSSFEIRERGSDEKDTAWINPAHVVWWVER